MIVCALSAATATKAKAEYTFTPVADSTGAFSDFFFGPSLNAGGTAAFFASLDNGKSGVFKGGGGSITTIAINNTAFSTVDPTINQAGTVAFYAFDWNGMGPRIVAGNGGPLVTIADTAGQFSDFGHASINATGTVAFKAWLDSGSGGIFASTGGVVTPVLINSASSGTAGNFTFNDSGTLAFRTYFQASNSYGIVTYNNGAITTIVTDAGPLNYFGSAPLETLNNEDGALQGRCGGFSAGSGGYKVKVRRAIAGRNMEKSEG